MNIDPTTSTGNEVDSSSTTSDPVTTSTPTQNASVANTQTFEQVVQDFQSPVTPAGISILEFAISVRENLQNFLNEFTKGTLSDQVLNILLAALRAQNFDSVAAQLQVLIQQFNSNNFDITSFTKVTNKVGTDTSSGATGTFIQANDQYNLTVGTFNHSSDVSSYVQAYNDLNGADPKSSGYQQLVDNYNDQVDGYNAQAQQVNSKAQALYNAAVAYNAAVLAYQTEVDKENGEIAQKNANRPPGTLPLTPRTMPDNLKQILPLPPQPPIVQLASKMPPAQSPTPPHSLPLSGSDINDSSINPAPPLPNTDFNSFVLTNWVTTINSSIQNSQSAQTQSQQTNQKLNKDLKKFVGPNSDEAKTYSRVAAMSLGRSSPATSSLAALIMGVTNPQLSVVLSSDTQGRTLQDLQNNAANPPPIKLYASVQNSVASAISDASITSIGPALAHANNLFTGVSVDGPAISTAISIGVAERLSGLVSDDIIQKILRGVVESSPEVSLVSEAGKSTAVNKLAGVASLGILGLGSVLLGDVQNSPGLFLRPMALVMADELPQSPTFNLSTIVASLQKNANPNTLQSELEGGFTQNLQAAGVAPDSSTKLASDLASGVLSPNVGDITAFVRNKLTGELGGAQASLLMGSVTNSMIVALYESQLGKEKTLPPIFSGTTSQKDMQATLATAFQNGGMTSDQASNIAAAVAPGALDIAANVSTNTGKIAALRALIEKNMPEGVSNSSNVFVQNSLVSLSSQTTLTPLENDAGQKRGAILKDAIQKTAQKLVDLARDTVQKLVKQEDTRLTQEMSENFSNFLAEVQKPDKFWQKLKENPRTAVGVIYEGVLSDPVKAGISTKI